MMNKECQWNNNNKKVRWELSIQSPKLSVQSADIDTLFGGPPSNEAFVVFSPETVPLAMEKLQLIGRQQQ